MTHTPNNDNRDSIALAIATRRALANVHHAHTADCIGANELDELCCLHLAGDHLRDADRYVVTFDNAHTINVFTDNDDDAHALALAAYPSNLAASAINDVRRDPQPNPYL